LSRDASNRVHRIRIEPAASSLKPIEIAERLPDNFFRLEGRLGKHPEYFSVIIAGLSRPVRNRLASLRLSQSAANVAQPHGEQGRRECGASSKGSEGGRAMAPATPARNGWARGPTWTPRRRKHPVSPVPTKSGLALIQRAELMVRFLLA
jgi:hypothetical protein